MIVVGHGANINHKNLELYKLLMIKEHSSSTRSAIELENCLKSGFLIGIKTLVNGNVSDWAGTVWRFSYRG